MMRLVALIDITFIKTTYFNCLAEHLVRFATVFYAENGYCFKTERYRDMFGNENCEYDDSEDVPLNRYERSNVDLIRRVEGAKDCD
jgi:hypothetical protein